MKDITCYDIQELMSQNIDVNDIIKEVRTIMEKEYSNYVEWFDNKLIPGIYEGNRNIITIYRNEKLVGFANLTKVKKESKISNLYINSKLLYKYYWNLLIDKSIDWLEEDKPVMIISNKEIDKCVHLFKERKWYVSDKTKNNDYILNRTNNLSVIDSYIPKIKKLRY